MENVTTANMMAPMGSASIQYEIDGHLYTTFVVAMLAGFSVDRALALGWGSQIPDASRKFTAVSAAWNALWNEKSRSIMKTLHSLHGGGESEVLRRRQELKSSIKASIERGAPEWRTGLMVHAYGDSYAHTYEENGKLKAYGYPLGHAPDGHQPDKIGNFPVKYLDYAANLYEVLGGREDPTTALAHIHAIVDILDDDPNRRNSEIREYAADLGMRDEESSTVRDRLLKEVSTADLIETMDEMEEHFRPGKG